MSLEPQESRKQDAHRENSPARILIVHDESATRAMIRDALTQHGHHTLTAATSREVDALLARHEFDLVLTDMMLADGSGLVLLEHVRQQHPHIPVVVVTAIQDVGVAIDAMRRGAYDYLIKPFEPHQLVAATTRALEHARQLNLNRSYQLNLERMVEARTEMLLQAVKDLEHSYDITLEALGDALDLKDAETEGHSKRVTAYTIALARAMGLGPEEVKTIARGAFLHDIGKMAIPDNILRKPGPLTPEEQEIMREHCNRGYQMLRKIPFLSESAEIVFSHQEHFDGGGYPSGLRGAEIPLGARIFSVADTLDAMTSDRPYRKALGFDKARAEIQRCSGTQFDPAVVEAFLRIPNELWTELRSEIMGQHTRFSTVDMTAEQMTDDFFKKDK